MDKIWRPTAARQRLGLQAFWGNQGFERVIACKRKFNIKRHWVFIEFVELGFKGSGVLGISV